MNSETVRAYANHRNLTVGQAESQMTEAILRVARILSGRYLFGYHTREDIEQVAAEEALLVLAEGDKYDPRRPLENFLHTHLRRRLSNFRRKHYLRLEPPCVCCGTATAPPSPCKRWLDWRKRNASKQNIMNMTALEEGEGRASTSAAAEEEAVSHELLAKIDAALPVDLRADYLRMREHIVIPKSRRQRVRDAVLAIIAEVEVSDAQV